MYIYIYIYIYNIIFFTRCLPLPIAKETNDLANAGQ